MSLWAQNAQGWCWFNEILWYFSTNTDIQTQANIFKLTIVWCVLYFNSITESNLLTLLTYHLLRGSKGCFLRYRWNQSMWNHLGLFCFLQFFLFRHGIHSKPAHRGSYDVLVSWYCMSWTMCAWKININPCADRSHPDTLGVRVSVFWFAVFFCFWIRPSSSPIISLCLCMCWFISTVLFWPSAGCLLFVSSCVNAEAFDHLWQCEYFRSF